jgi:hypothetical protein
MESDFDKFGSDNDLPPQSLEVKCKQIMVHLGQIEFEKAAEENEKRKSKDFDQIYRSSSGSQNGLPKSENTNETASPRQADASVVDTVARDRQPVLGAEAVTRESSENLSFSIQQDDSGGRENISLGNIPPTSVATTLYNNYKLLLLSLARRLLSSDVVKLMEWATFSIENAQNATDVLLQLDQKGIINASDLSPLRDFFESIVRFDLAHIIDTFLLGDYNLLRDPQRPGPQRPAMANTRHPGFFGSIATQPRTADTTSKCFILCFLLLEVASLPDLIVPLANCTFCEESIITLSIYLHCLKHRRTKICGKKLRTRTRFIVVC